MLNAISQAVRLSPAPMTTSGSLRTKLAIARQSLFTGREAELRRFRDCLRSEHVAVLHVHGPGGVGKTWLLDQMARVASEEGIAVARLDARDIEPSPTGVRQAIGQNRPNEQERSPARRFVLMVDTYERLEAIDEWFRENVIANLDAGTLVVLAGRNRPAPSWLSDAGWAALSEVMPLRNFRPDEALRYLERRGVEESRRKVLMSISHGHPLALSLLTDLESRGDDTPPNSLRDQPDLVRILLDRFVSGIEPGPKKSSLEIAAHTRVTTEDLLRDALELDDASDVFNWLRGLSFMQEGPLGLFPHDLVRDVLDADLRWRDQRRYMDIHARVRSPIVRRIRTLSGAEQHQAAMDLLYLHRNGPVMGEVFHWASLGIAREEPARDEDLPRILDIVERFEGPESARIIRYWHGRDSSRLYAHRGNDGDLSGFGLSLRLAEPNQEDMDADPAIAAMWDFVERTRPLRPGETVIYHRSFMDATAYQTSSPSLNLIAMRTLLDWVASEMPGWSFIAASSLEYWAPVFAYIDQTHFPTARFFVGGREFHVFGHDWLARPPDVWLELMGEREIAGAVPMVTPADDDNIVLSRADFEQAVRQALKDFHQPAKLRLNPLLRSRAVVHANAAHEGVEALRSLLIEAAQALCATPRDQKLYRALHHTFVQPAGSQERAAELLDLPFNTYRYHLSGAIRRVTDYLWMLELDR